MGDGYCVGRRDGKPTTKVRQNYRQDSDLVSLIVPIVDPFDFDVVTLELGGDLLRLRPQVELIGNQTLIDDLFQCLHGSLCDDLLDIVLAQLHVGSNADPLIKVELDFINERFHCLVSVS